MAQYHDHQRYIKLGISSFTESDTVLQTVGKVGIGTTNAQSYSLNVVGDANIVTNSSSNALTITQMGSGDALVVEDSSSPDATPFIVKGDGKVAIGTVNPLNSFVVSNGLEGIEFSPGAVSNKNRILNVKRNPTGYIEQETIADAFYFSINNPSDNTLIITSGKNVGISTSPTEKLDVNGNIRSLDTLISSQLNVSGITTLASSGGITTTGGDLYVGDNLFVKNQIRGFEAVITGLATVNSLSVSNNFDVYDTTATFHNNVFIAGNLSIGGTATNIFAQDLKVFDKEITLGITTDAFGNDISNDITANHGGISIASTEGSPLVDLSLVGFSTLPKTYKQLMWVAANSYGVGTTDAWMFNYAVGIGSTLVPNGVYLAVGSIQATKDTITTPYFNATNINVTGISTIGIVSSSSLYVTGLSTFVGVATFGSTVFIKDSLFVNGIGITGTNTFIDADIVTRNFKATGVSTFVGVGTFTNDLFVGGDLYVKDDVILDELTARNINVTGLTTVGVVSAISVNATGIITANSFRPSSGFIQAADGTNSFFIFNSTGNVAFQGTIGASSINNGQGFQAIDFSANSNPNVLIPNNLNVSGISTLAANGGITTTGGDLFVGGDLYVKDDLILDELTARNINITGIGTIVNFNATTSSISIGNIVSGVVTSISGTNLNYTGVGTITTLNSTTSNLTTANITNANIVTGIVTNISGTDLNYIGVGTITTLNSTTGNIANLNTTNANILSGIVTTITGTTANYTTGNITNANIVTGIVTNISGTNLNYTGVGTITNLGGTNLNYTGVGTITTLNSTNATITNLSNTNINSSGIITATQFSTGATGSAINITSNTISGPAEMIIDPAAVGDNSGAIRIKGDLLVDGTQTIINSTTIELADFNVGIATTVGTNLLLDGAGIGIGSTNIRKTLTYAQGSDSLKSSENFDLAAGKVYKINGVEVLSSTQLNTTNINAPGITTVGFITATSLFAGIGTIDGVFIGSGIVTSANPGVVTVKYFGDGSNLIGVNAFNVINQDLTASPVYPTFANNIGVTSIGISTTQIAFIPSSGNLGIGTTNPTSKLSVQGDVLVSGIVTIGNVRITNTGIITSANPGVSTVVYFGDGSNLIGVNAFNVINQGISTSPVFLTFANSTGVTSIGIAATQVGYIPEPGNLGIGTTAPSQRLDVNGNVRIRGGIFDSNNLIGNSGYVLTSNGSSIVWQSAGGIGIITNPAGTDGQIQYNNAGIFSGTAALYYDDTNNRVGINSTNPAYALEVNQGDINTRGGVFRVDGRNILDDALIYSIVFG